MRTIKMLCEESKVKIINLEKNMRKVIFGLLMVVLSTSAIAGRSTPTTIKSLIVKSDYVEIWTNSTGGDCSINNGWHLLNTNPNFNALYSGFLASKTSGKQVDIVGAGACDGSYEIVSWAYVAM
ncbi:hypothetical protein LZP73_08715 [Shewanella sp. AS16]|uniref:hypothetical protein n=1 Tax=Shewanella sp. AS16 TaxID=2907625 RepID=UPI001F3A60F3|nr:hypothetical protein [Shewanella sp. AS16]MCE9686292.1 hypothetical protein [Shewanella sp. AS16]